MDLKPIDNVNARLGDDLKETIPGHSRLRLAAATFSFYAYEALRAELESVEEIEFLFSGPSFTPDSTVEHARRERRRYFIPEHEPEHSLYGTEFEVHLRNRLTQRAIARECADWIRRKVRFRANTSGGSIPAFAVVDDDVAYQPLDGFTTSDLGYAESSASATLIQRFAGAGAARAYLSMFDGLWADPERTTDVTAQVLDHIEHVYQENSPQRVYFLVLYSVFSEFLEDLDRDRMPDERTGYQQTEIWQRLYNFQKDAAVGIINKLDTLNGCILADSVGLGKTFTALAVIKYYELRNKRILVLCPKKLAENWKTYNSNVKDNILAADRFDYDVLNHTDLLRESGFSHGVDLSRFNWGNYDLVVIDESHNFRNADYAEEKESRYQRLLRAVVREGVQTKVLMLSATPVNTRFNDLKNQLQLAYDGDSTGVEEQLGLSTSVEKVFAEAQAAFNEWTALDTEERTGDRLLRMLDFDFFTLLDGVTIARSRKHVQDFYGAADVGTFPTRRPPVSLREPLTELDGPPPFSAIVEQLETLNLGVYSPLDYVFPSHLPFYLDKYDSSPQRRAALEAGIMDSDDGAAGAFGQRGREAGIKKLMIVNLLKRLESSVEAFRLTIRRVESAIDSTLGTLTAYEGGAGDFGSVAADLDAELSEGEDTEVLQFGKNIEIALADVDIPRWRNDLWHDRETLRELLDALMPVTPQHDAKLQRLVEVVRTKATTPLNEGNRKVLIFSAFADTATYLFDQLQEPLADLGLESALITGGVQAPRTSLAGGRQAKGMDFHRVMTLFSPRSKSKDALFPDDDRQIDVLIATDVISEGQNLQDCDMVVNYDIHWNPVRIIQRFGRVDRIGSANAQIQMVNFWPDVSLDEYIDLKARVENRMELVNVTATADDNLLTRETVERSYRDEQLEKLQTEVLDLEDATTGVAITDLGLNDVRMDLLAYVKSHPELPRSPKGLHAVLRADAERGLPPGVIFALRNVHADEAMHRGNRLHPSYLLYIDEDGQVVTDHRSSKHLLDLLRRTARDEVSPLPEPVAVFNARTQEGANMEQYSRLLTAGVRSMVQVTEELAVDSLFTTGPTTALEADIEGLDDFELIGFFAVVDVAGHEDG